MTPTDQPLEVRVLTSRLLTSIRQGRPVVGWAHMIRDEAVTETLRDVDVDFLLVDMQHVASSIETLQLSLIALQPTDLPVLVRSPWNDQATIGQILDIGAAGVIVPMVNTEADARRAVAAARYPPDGVRSWGPRRVARFHGDATGYAHDANDNVVVITQVETQEAIDNLDDILAVPGLSGIMIGPADLAISLGYMHDRDHQAVQDAIGAVLDRCLEAGVPFGFFAATIERALHWMERGALILNCSSDATFVTQGFARVSAEVDAARARMTQPK